jgi:uncharacterized protein
VPDVRIADNPEARRYEAFVDGELMGIAQYLPVEGRLIFTHTEVDTAVEGQGIGSRLAQGIFDDLRRRGLKATLRCPFLSAHVRRNPEYADVVHAESKEGKG